MTDPVDETSSPEVDLPAVPSAPPDDALAAATEAAAAVQAPSVRYRPMPMPSAPFWLLLIAAVVVVTILAVSWSVIVVFAIGVVLFAILLPIVNWLDRRGVRRGLASFAVVLVAVVIAVGAVLVALSVVFDQLVPFVASIPDYLEQMQEVAPAWLASGIQNILDAISGAVSNIDPGTVVLGFLQGILGMVGTALSLTLLPFFVFYLLVDQPRMARGVKEDIPGPWRVHVETAMRIFVHDFASYFKAEVIVGLIQGTMVTIGVWIIGQIVGPPLSDYVLLLGVIAGVMELLPQIGPILSLIPALLLALATSPLAVVLVSIFYVTVFIIEANVLVPKIEGEVVSFSPATVLFLVAVGLSIGGIIGGIVVLPVAAIIRDLFGFIFRQAERDSLVDPRAPPVAPL